MQSNCMRNCGGAWPGPVFAVVVSFGCEKVRPAALCHRESAKKFAQRAQNTPNSAFLRLLGEFFRGKAAGGAVLGEFFRVDWHCARVSEAERLPPCRQWWGFCATRGLLVACRRRVGPSCSAIPPLHSAASVFVGAPGFPCLLMDVPYPHCDAHPAQAQQNRPARSRAVVERATGIEPASEAWEASILPMNYARNSSSRRNRPVDHIVTSDSRATGATCRLDKEEQ